MAMVRAETIEDGDAVRRVNELAFGRSNEADLVDLLRQNAHPHISLVGRSRSPRGQPLLRVRQTGHLAPLEICGREQRPGPA